MSTGAGVLTGHETHLYIGGEWVSPADGRTVEVINPTTEEPIGSVALGGPADIDRAVRAARAAFDAGPWAASTPVERAAIMTRAGGPDRRRAEVFARTITLEVGSPVAIADRQPLAAKLYPRLVRRARLDISVGGGGARRDPRPAARAPPAGRRRRRDHPLELPAGAVVPEARPGAAHRLHRRAEAARGDAAVRIPAR